MPLPAILGAIGNFLLILLRFLVLAIIWIVRIIVQLIVILARLVFKGILLLWRLLLFLWRAIMLGIARLRMAFARLVHAKDPTSLSKKIADINDFMRKINDNYGRYGKKADELIGTPLTQGFSATPGDPANDKGVGKLFSWFKSTVSSLKEPKSTKAPSDPYKIYLNTGKSSFLSTFIKTFFIILFIIILLTIIMQSTMGINLLPANIMRDIATGFAKFWVAFSDWTTNFTPKEIVNTWDKWLSRQIAVGTGGYYEGKVDEKSRDNLQLGVIIKEFKPQRQKFFTDETVTLWARIQAKALEFDDTDTTLELKTWCEYKTEKKTIATEPKLIQIDRYGDEFVDCEFSAQELGEGYKYITLYVLYEFSTKSYLRTYFMEDSHIKSYLMQNKDPLAEYKITERRPISTFTNGPVKLGIGTNEEFPLRVRDNGQFATLYGLTIDNRHPSDGIIKELKDIKIKMPVSLAFDQTSCDFSMYKGEIEVDEVLGEQYMRYTLIKDEKKLTERKLKDIDQFLTLNCKVNIQDKQDLLRDSPLAVKFFRAEIVYDYQMSKRAMVQIAKEPLP